MDNFDDAVLFRQEVANLFAGFITRPSPGDLPPIDPINGGPVRMDGDGFTPMVGLEPGTMQELLPGEQVEFSKPPEAGNNYPDFMRQQLQAAAMGTGVPYELFTGDLRNVNDRVIRVVLNEFRRRLEQLQFSVYIHQLCRPAGLASRSEVVLRKGYDAETIDEENAADQTRAHELGLNYTTAPGSPDPADEETP